MSNAVAGWYPDPSDGVGLERYWDGSAWTGQTRMIENLPSCPKCGSTHIQGVAETSGGFDAGSGICGGILGYLCLGPIGLICALCGVTDKKTKVSRLCLNCGNKF